jgi:hypothetical protein
MTNRQGATPALERITDEEWSSLCAQVKQWEKLARDQDEQTPAGDGGQRLPRRKICPLCDLPPDSQCQFANCKRRWAE